MSDDRFDFRRRRLLIGTGGLLLAARGTGFARLASAAPTPAKADAPRVVVIGGALAEIVYALGRADTLVGADTTCTYPPQAQALPKVGYQRALSAEGLLSLQPTLILASAEAGPPSVLQRVADAGVKLATFGEGHDVASVREKIVGVARALDAENAGQTLLARFDRAWTEASAQVAQSPRPATQPRVLFLMSPAGNQPMVAGQHTAADAMLAYAGARNAMQGFPGYRALTPEALVAAQPDIVLTTDDALKAAGSKRHLLDSAGFVLTPAGRSTRVVALDALFLLGFGPRLPEAVSALNRSLAKA
ncbi:iron complex transport system substrate-binding protein [Paraburkholderia eburnea]|uniref:Iron complex transport system substrate-binding protein n=1 Tax=Paraburkholderia eburnea TaxID=1189126 RepID=A0A2S4M6F6_9BURK|nr:helical backbone metal receptor [Paraburkholderia eburnea]POR50235.1 iron complex transport system substrate-binding protein [Paraburkholderia eburnea]PRZ20484.1 iron complex transport system substrate-binding protein [Paraburkholderia eburnea]